MSAVLGAFVQYVLEAIYFVVIIGLGIFAGKKLSERKKAKASEAASE
ncbi:MAG: vanadium nitrogenase [Clostridiales bacterium]|nr:vanadium nitrogenase [Clostridiales bacterium]